MPTLLLILIFLWVVTAVHEAGHALAVRLKGGQVVAFEVGRGPAVRGVAPGGTRMALGLFPVGGRIVYRGIPTGTGHAVVATAGPAANLLLAFLMLQSATWAGEWFWLVPGSVVEIVANGRALGLLHGMRIIGAAMASGVLAEWMFALGALSAVWAGLNLLPIPGVGSDGWTVLSSLAAAIRADRGTSPVAADPEPDPDGVPGASDRREVS